MSNYRITIEMESGLTKNAVRALFEDNAYESIEIEQVDDE